MNEAVTTDYLKVLRNAAAEDLTWVRVRTDLRRLTGPLIGVNGVLREATRDVVLDRVVPGFRRNLRSHGPVAVGMTARPRATDKIDFAAQEFIRSVIGSHNVDSCNRT